MTRKPPHLFLYTDGNGVTHWREPSPAVAPSSGTPVRVLRYLCGEWVTYADSFDSLVAVEDAPIEPDTCIECVRVADELWPVTVR